jgi:hypothetical protein
MVSGRGWRPPWGLSWIKAVIIRTLTLGVQVDLCEGGLPFGNGAMTLAATAGRHACRPVVAERYSADNRGSGWWSPYRLDLPPSKVSHPLRMLTRTFCAAGGVIG